MPTMGHAGRKIFIYSLPTIIIFIFAVFFSFTNLSHYTWDNIPVHSTVESTGAIIAIILSIILLSTTENHPQEFYKVAVSSALLGMGILDLFHSSVSPSQNFVWFHSSATLLGGVFFSLVWLSPKVVFHPTILPIISLAISLSLVFIALFSPGNTPTMLQGGQFTSSAKALHLFGGLGFTFAAAWFYRNYYYKSNSQYILFANHCLLFGVSALIFEISNLWCINWWLWHGTRLLAYMVAMLLIFRIYRNIDKEKDLALIELREALKNIKVLKGFLPICASCKKIRDDKGYWNQIEAYIKEHSEANFSHGICPECAEKLYPGLNLKEKI
ncbi:MAG: hypothetical protein R6W72_07375 [Desulfurivibrionaceae bacterium]